MKDLSEYKRNLRQTRICAKCGKPFVPHTPSAKYCDDCNTGRYVERNLKGEHYEPTRVTTKLGHRLEEAKRMGLSYGKYMAWLKRGANFGGIDE